MFFFFCIQIIFQNLFKQKDGGFDDTRRIITETYNQAINAISQQILFFRVILMNKTFLSSFNFEQNYLILFVNQHLKKYQMSTISNKYYFQDSQLIFPLQIEFSKFSSIIIQDMQILTTTVAILMLVNLATALSMKGHDESLPEFCWRDTYGRGVGVIPSICPAGKDKIGLLCYTKCPEGFKRFGFDCYQLCPASATWNDQGLFCRLSEYGRGAGYPWKFGDPLNDRGSKGRCESANGIGNCEKNGLLYYPKCRSGYYSIGCCICRPSIPNCKALGFNGGFDLSCTKKIIIGDPKNMDCPPGKFYDAGLCYAGCKTGYLEVGPLCWGNGPAGWIDCGMGAAKDQKTCSETIFDEVTSVGSLALNLATAGTGKAASIAKNFAEAAKLETLFEKMKDLANKSGKVQDVISKGQGKFPVVAAGKSTGELLKADPDTLTPEDMVRVSAQIAALTDPTGASDKFVATTYPKCTTIQL